MSGRPYIQDSIHAPLAVRETAHYQAEYVQAFVEKWDRLIDWWLARVAERLHAHGAKKVLCVV